MGKAMTLLSGMGLGAGLMCLLDPVSGKRRRALLRDKTLSAWQRTEEAIEGTAHDMESRFQGLRSEAEHLLREGRLSDRSRDSVLAFEVRAALALAASHAQAIRVTVDQGRVTLRGAVLRQDVDDVLSAIEAVPNIQGVNNHLSVVDRPEQLPADQGTPLFSAQSPEGRLVFGTAGGALVLYGLAHRGIIGTTAGLTGLSLLVRGFGSDRLQHMLGMSGDNQQRQQQGQGGTLNQPQANAPQVNAPQTSAQQVNAQQANATPQGPGAPAAQAPQRGEGRQAQRGNEPARRGERPGPT